MLTNLLQSLWNFSRSVDKPSRSDTFNACGVPLPTKKLSCLRLPVKKYTAATFFKQSFFLNFWSIFPEWSCVAQSWTIHQKFLPRPTFMATQQTPGKKLYSVLTSLPVGSISAMIFFTSASVGFNPRALNISPISPHSTFPSPCLSNNEKVSRCSE